MTENQLTEEQQEALRKVFERVKEIMDRVLKMFEDFWKSLRASVERVIVSLRIAWRHYLLFSEPNDHVYEWWLLVAARRQLVFAA